MWITFSLPCLKIRKIFVRLLIGITIFLLGIISLLIIDVVGHSLELKTSNQTQCMFHINKTLNTTVMSYSSLHMHWSVLILPTILLGIGPLQVITTVYEFIAAQSPQSMKGFLIGVLFAIRGLSRFLNSIIISILSLKYMV